MTTMFLLPKGLATRPVVALVSFPALGVLLLLQDTHRVEFKTGFSTS